MYFIEMLPCRGQEVMNLSRTELLNNHIAWRAKLLDPHRKRRLGRQNKEAYS